MAKLDTKEQLIYQLLFSDDTVIDVQLDKYSADRDIKEFMSEIKAIIERGNIKISNEQMLQETTGKVWKLKLNRLKNVDK